MCAVRVAGRSRNVLLQGCTCVLYFGLLGQRCQDLKIVRQRVSSRTSPYTRGSRCARTATVPLGSLPLLLRLLRLVELVRSVADFVLPASRLGEV